MIGEAWLRLSLAFRRFPLAWVLLLALLLRLIQIEGRGLHYDDTFSIFLASRSLAEIVSGTAADTMPPLYYFLLHFWLMVSREVWFIRLLSVLLNLLTIVLLFQLVERWFGRGAAAWASFLAAISPLQIYHAQDVRMYALLVLAQVGYVWSFTHVWFASKEGKARLVDWAGLVFFGLAAMYSHNLAGFALLVPNLFLLAQRRWNLQLKLIAAQALVGLGALPWLLMLPGQLEKIQRAFWTPRPGPVEIIQAIILFTASMPLPFILLAVSAILSFQILLFITLEVWRGRREPGILYLAALLLIPPALLFSVSYLMRPVFVTRGFLVSSLAYYALAGFAITRGWGRGAGKIIAGAFVLAVAMSLPYHYSFEGFPRSPFNAAASYLRQTAPDALVIHETKLSYFPARFYEPALFQRFLADIPGSANDTFAPGSQQAMQMFPSADLAQAIGDRQDFYFVTFSQVFEEYKAAGDAQPPNIRWLEEHFQLADRQVFNDLEIYHYVR